MAHSTGSDEERLRRALALIGEEVGRDVAPLPPEPRSERRRRPWVGKVLAAAGATVMLGVLVFGIATTRGDDENRSGDAGQSLTPAEEIACSRLIAVGEVVAVEESTSPDRIILTFDVQDPISPAEGMGIVELELVDPVVADERDPFTPGETILLMVYERGDEAPEVWRGDEIEERRSLFENSLAEAAETTCPSYWQEDGTDDPTTIPGDA